METSSTGMPGRLGRSQGRYGGEGIEIGRVLGELRREAASRGWRVEVWGRVAAGELWALERPAAAGAPTVYLSAGIHGDEPAGVLAILELVKRDQWPLGVRVVMCPCLNPGGFPLNQRGNAEGVDLNRDYREPRTAEVRRHVAWLERQPEFAMALCLHEDWEAEGFYLYELNPEGRESGAERAMERVRAVCPVDESPLIEGREARGGIIRPQVDMAARPDWPEAFYLLQRKTRQSYTLEAASDYEMGVRVRALVVATEALLGV